MTKQIQRPIYLNTVVLFSSQRTKVFHHNDLEKKRNSK